MGISASLVSLLLDEERRRPFTGKLLTLGRQTVQASAHELRPLLSRYGLSLNSQCVNDQVLFSALGFELIESLDLSDFEGATHCFDLNKAEPPVELLRRYDVVLDSGTIEHVFDTRRAMMNALSFLAVGGRAIFATPSSNHLEHGFYMFSPMFFFEYLTANRFDIDTLYVVRASHGHRPEVYEYRPGLWEDVQIGGLDGSAYLIFAVATKTERSTVDVIPQQGAYRSRWGIEAASDIPAFSSAGRERIKRALATFPRAYAAARWLELAKRHLRQALTGVPTGLQNKKLIRRL